MILFCFVVPFFATWEQTGWHKCAQYLTVLIFEWMTALLCLYILHGLRLCLMLNNACTYKMHCMQLSPTAFCQALDILRNLD